MTRRTPDIDESLREKTLSGQKSCFIRGIQYLQTDDQFEIFDAKFVVTKVEFDNLDSACRRLYAEAGYDSYEVLKNTWIASHGQFNLTQRAVIHWIERIE